jgi:hypothetical protein
MMYNVFCVVPFSIGKSAILKALPYMSKYVNANMSRRLAAEIIKVKQIQHYGVAAATAAVASAAAANHNDSATPADNSAGISSTKNTHTGNDGMPAYRQIGNRLLTFTLYASYCNKLKKEQRSARAVSDSQSTATGKSGFSGMSGMCLYCIVLHLHSVCHL